MLVPLLFQYDWLISSYSTQILLDISDHIQENTCCLVALHLLELSADEAIIGKTKENVKSKPFRDVSLFLIEKKCPNKDLSLLNRNFSYKDVSHSSDINCLWFWYLSQLLRAISMSLKQFLSSGLFMLFFEDNGCDCDGKCLLMIDLMDNVVITDLDRTAMARELPRRPRPPKIITRTDTTRENWNHFLSIFTMYIVYDFSCPKAALWLIVTNWYTLLKNTTIEHSENEETWPDQYKYKYI